MPDNKPAESNFTPSPSPSASQTVTVRALRHFRKDPGGVGVMVAPGDEFEITRGRAIGLRAEGLIEDISAADEPKSAAAPVEVGER